MILDRIYYLLTYLLTSTESKHLGNENNERKKRYPVGLTDCDQTIPGRTPKDCFTHQIYF